MDELIEEVMRQTGLPEEQARAAAEAVLSHLAEHLPEPAAGMVVQFATPPVAPEDPEKGKKAAIASAAATAAAVNVVVLPGAH